MTAHTRTAPNMDRSFWFILDAVDGENSVHFTKDDAEIAYRSMFWGDATGFSEAAEQARWNTGIRVVEFNAVEGWSSDVTGDFADWGADDDSPRSYSEARRFERAATPVRM